MFAQKNDTVAKLSSIEQSVNDNGNRISAIHTETSRLIDEIKAANTRMSDISLTLVKTEDSQNAQTAAIENLTKAKKTLFNRVNLIETEISKLGILPVQQE